MTVASAKRVLSIPPGLPFLKTLGQALLDGRLVPDFRYDPDDPLSLADVTIFVPTRRAARALRSEFVDLLGGRSAILPVIRPLGETDDDSGFFDSELPLSANLYQPLSGTARLLELSRLVLAWRNHLPQAITDLHSGSPLAAPASPADAIWLAKDLTELIDSIETEERDWNQLEEIDASQHASWWQLTLEFLKIARTFWPARLEELHRSSPAHYRNSILRHEAERFGRQKPQGPVIVAGSTGSLPATAELIMTVAGLQQGCVVLPGLDRHLDDAQWNLILQINGEGLLSKDPSKRAHPQFGLALLLRKMGLQRSDIDDLGVETEVLAQRSQILSQAMVPPQATSGWREWRDLLPDSSIEDAFSSMALIEASNEREEALAIAVALRLAVDEGGDNAQVALVTPDRTLARRVACELARFGIEADDSSGTPFLTSPQGTLLQLLLEASLRPGDPVAVVSLLKHPLARFGRDAASVKADVEALEILSLRGGVGEVDLSTMEPQLVQRLEQNHEDTHPPKWRDSLDADAEQRAILLAADVGKAVEPLVSALVRHRETGRGHTRELPLTDWAKRTGEALEAVAVGGTGSLSNLWSDEGGDTLATLLTSIMESESGLVADGGQWIDIVKALSAGEMIKPRSIGHPQVFIWGTLEARLQSVDLMVVAGLNEGTWPGQTANNPFLSRTMKTDIGLEPPERRVGQVAHDFAMAHGIEKLIYSRSLRQGSAPTVASRWLQRLLALGGKDLGRQLKARGDRYRMIARQLDEGERQAAAPRPEPRPPAHLVPLRYSFSEVGRLRRDPYSIYAKRILRLDVVDPFNQDPGASERGTLYHAIIERFVREGHKAGAPNAFDLMTAILNEEFDTEQLPPHVDAVWRPRFAEVARAFLRWEAERAPEIRSSHTEVKARMQLSGGLVVTGLADRIDRIGSGSADIVDYKTGFAPTVAQARALLDPQLALEAAALERGGFESIGPLAPQNLVYVRLKPGDKFKAETVNNEHAAKARSEPKSAAQLAAESVAELQKLVDLLISGKRGFVSRLIPAKQGDRTGDYDHLARVAEWATADSEEAGDE